MEGTMIIDGNEWRFSATGVTPENRWPPQEYPKHQSREYMIPYSYLQNNQINERSNLVKV